MKRLGAYLLLVCVLNTSAFFTIADRFHVYHPENSISRLIESIAHTFKMTFTDTTEDNDADSEPGSLDIVGTDIICENTHFTIILTSTLKLVNKYSEFNLVYLSYEIQVPPPKA